MLNMKKDMGGAATAFALGHMIMARKLKVRCASSCRRWRIRFPAPASGRATSTRRARASAWRSAIPTPKGRLILADALALASEDKPALIVDFATLTGAARVALGPDVPPFFTDDDALAAEFMRHGAAENDPVWRMPLWRPYEAMLEFESGRSQQCRRRRPWRRHHRRAVPAPLRRCAVLAASRHFRLDARGQARPAGRRRIAVGARALCHARGALLL